MGDYSRPSRIFIWVFAAIITLITPTVLDNFSEVTIFVFFAFMMVLQLIWVLVIMPETKGVPLEELQKKLVRNDEREMMNEK